MRLHVVLGMIFAFRQCDFLESRHSCGDEPTNEKNVTFMFFPPCFLSHSQQCKAQTDPLPDQTVAPSC